MGSSERSALRYTPLIRRTSRGTGAGIQARQGLRVRPGRHGRRLGDGRRHHGRRGRGLRRQHGCRPGVGGHQGHPAPGRDLPGLDRRIPRPAPSIAPGREPDGQRARTAHLHRRAVLGPRRVIRASIRLGRARRRCVEPEAPSARSDQDTRVRFHCPPGPVDHPRRRRRPVDRLGPPRGRRRRGPCL